MDVHVNLEGLPLEEARIEAKKPDAAAALDRLWSGEMDMTGWVKAPMEIDPEELSYLLDVADIIRSEAELLVVLGIGGSYMGAKAAIEALPRQERGIEVRFLGINFCTEYYREILDLIRTKETVICAISKSGNTMEVRTALEVIRPVMDEKYGEGARRRIIAITDPVKGTLREEANERDYVTFDVPGNIGGRYSMMTPAGLLPMAVAGIDVREILRGAEVMASSPAWDSYGADYAIARYLMHAEEAKAIESIAFNHSRMGYFGEWLKQLYGESEGKEGKGLFPASVDFTADLHSMGQYIQQGERTLLETVVRFAADPDQLTVPHDDVNGDGLNFLEGKTMDFINRQAMDGTLLAHVEGGVPNLIVSAGERNARTLGELIYFFEFSCGLSGYLLGVNPFDQPGVEAYKKNMFALLGKPGYEEAGEALRAKLSK